MSSQSDVVTTIDMLRHGACDGGEIYRGSTDVALSQEGWRQMEQATTTNKWQTIITSPLIRCRSFAEQCSTENNIPFHVISGLREMDFGEWEGRLLQEVWHSDPKMVSQFYDDPSSVTPPGGEPALIAQERIVEAWRTILEQYGGQHLLLICHAGVIRLLLSDLLNMPLRAIARLHIPYASISRIKVYQSEGRNFPMLMSLNSHGEQQ